MPVRILDEQVINKIAAGEVVERPASVVKELVENALDAGATELRVHLRAGGRNLIRIVDNGSGMNRTDALLCIERHATSKIRSEVDLFTVNTLGFRGEAIPSIASVSRFELLTRPRDEEVGTVIRLEGGRLTAADPAGCAPGTEISVGALFFNVPARRKFLRSVDTELGHCVEAVTREALVRPQLDLEVTHDDRELVRCPPVASRARRAADLLGPHGEALVPVTYTRGDLTVEALVSPVGVHRSTATGSSWLYVNGRFVKDLVLRRAVMAAYAGIVPKDRYPMVILEVRIPPADVDVNVHPAKTEVRFARAWELQQAVTEGLRAALQERGIERPVATEARYRSLEVHEPVRQAELWSGPVLTPSVTPEWSPAPRPVASPPPVAGALPIASRVVTAAPAAPAAPAALAGPPSPTRLTPSGRTLLPTERFRDLRVIGQLSATYVLCEGAGELVVVDQHAAHERVTLHRLRLDARAVLGGGQRLLTPLLVDLPPARARALAPHVDRLGAWGLDVAPLGGSTFAIQAVPAPLKDADLSMLLADVADELAADATPAAVDDRMEHVLATLACHTSVRAGQVLSTREMEELLKSLDDVDFSVCAHGRPVVIRMDRGELERRFHRS